MPKAIVRFMGVRGSLARPSKETLEFGGNTPCLEIRYGSELIICDTGTGIYRLGRELGNKGVNATILYTHYHWDHMIGLPFFAPIYGKKNRFTIIGRKGLKIALNNMLKAPNFPVRLRDLTARIKLVEKAEGKFNIGKIRVEAFDVNHPNGAFGYKFTFPNKKTLVFVSDNGPENNNIKLIDRIYGADLFIHDAQYLPEEYLKRRKFGHSTYNYILDVSRGCNIKNIALFHHDPLRTDEQLRSIEKKARKLGKYIGSGSRIFAAREGTSIRI